MDISQVLTTVMALAHLLGSFIIEVIKNPIMAVILGAVIALAGRYVIYGVGLALLVYGAIRLALAFLGIAPL